MDRQELEKFLVSKFIDRQDAEVAAEFLEEAGFLAEQVQIETLGLKPKFTLPESNAIESGKGGAIAGAILGSTIGLSLSLIVKSVPDVNLTVNIPSVLMVIIGGIVGALAIGIIGAITGGQIPKTHPETENEPIALDYGLSIIGKQEDLNRAEQILRQRGIQV
jgi:membrane protein DedA with SNARE-associated domain